jgi:hypothetical protein
MQRGWKLLVVESENKHVNGSWRAAPHAVLRINRDDGTSVYRCATADNAGKNFLFIPSSRMAPTMTDEQVLSGEYVFCSVVGGAPAFLQAMLRILPKAVASTPEEAIARLIPKAIMPVGFLQWARMRFPYRDAFLVAEDMGLPMVRSGENTDIRDERAKNHELWQQLHCIGESARTEQELLKRIVALFDFHYDSAVGTMLKDIDESFQKECVRGAVGAAWV